VLVHAVGGEDEDVAHLDRNGDAVELDLRAHPQGPAEIVLVVRDDDPVIFRDLFEGATGEPADPRVAGVEDVGGAGAQHQGAQRRHAAPV